MEVVQGQLYIIKECLTPDKFIIMCKFKCLWFSNIKSLFFLI